MQAFQCVPISCESVALKWEAPEKLGAPPLHKFKLERQQTRMPQDTVAAPVWETANGDLDDEDTTWIDSSLQVGEYQYRMTAWNALGWSEYSVLSGCDTANASLPCPPHKCWSEGSCKPMAASSTLEHSIAAESAIMWKLLCSFGGMAVVSLVSARLLSFRRRQALQEAVLERCASTFGLGKPSKPPAMPEKPGASEYEHREETPPLAAIPPQPEDGLQDPYRRPGMGASGRFGSHHYLLHNDSSNSRASGTSSGSPRSRLQIQASRSDLFFPNEVETFQNPLEGPSSSRMPLPNLRVGNRSQHAALNGEQEVLWLDSEGQEVHPPPVVEIPPSPQAPSRHGCAYPGCEKSLHPIFNPRSAMTSHYCSICQSVFCQRHTQYSPHGRLGSCGMESKCICRVCYDDLPQVTRERLERSNKLPKAKKDPVQVQNGSSGKDAAGKSKRGLFGGVKGGHQLVAADSRTASSTSTEHLDHARVASASRLATESGARNWSRLRTTWFAAMRFRGAGRERRLRSEDGS